MTENFFAAAFVTPEHTRLGLYNERHLPVIAPVRINTDCWNPAAHLMSIAEGIKHLHGKTGPNTQVERVVVAVAGKIHKRGRSIERASRLAKWKGTDIPGALSEALGNIPVHLGNAAEARSRHEALNNSRIANTPALTLYWGEGIGGSFIAKYGAVTPLDPGHMIVPGLSKSPLCLCSDDGHLDAVAGGAHIGDVLNRSRLGYLTPELADGFADHVAKVYSQLLTQYKCNHIVIGGQRYLNPKKLQNKKMLHDGLIKGFNRHLGRTPILIESELDYAPVETALTLLNRKLVSA